MKWCGLILFALFTVAYADSEVATPSPQDWSFKGPLGTFKRDELQRGLKVYKEVCATCHSLKQVSFRSLRAIGLSDAEIKAFAAQFEVPDDPNDEGQILPRKALLSDNFPLVYANEKAARAANNGALPPDLSVITKARLHGADYLYALLTGYQAAPAGVTLGAGQYYNPYMSGRQIAMPPPLQDGLVTYDDGTVATVAQMSRDVVAFLAWTAEPELEERHRLGIKVLFYLLVMTVLLYLVKRKIWADLEH